MEFHAWQDDHWAFIHTATEHVTGGILVMVSKRVIHPDHLGYDIKIPGRLMHVRLHYSALAVDIVAAYQTVDHRTQRQLLRPSCGTAWMSVSINCRPEIALRLWVTSIVHWDNSHLGQGLYHFVGRALDIIASHTKINPS